MKNIDGQNGWSYTIFFFTASRRHLIVKDEEIKTGTFQQSYEVIDDTRC
jgi:hypothetical protein